MSDRDLDRLLVERVQRGDKQAFGLLVTKYQRKLARLVSRLIWNSSDVEDVVQESFIRAYRALPDFRNDSAFYTWLYRIGVNSAKDWLVSNRARISATSAVDIEDVENYEIAEHHRDNDTPEEVLMSKQIAATVNAAVADLPEDMRNREKWDDYVAAVCDMVDRTSTGLAPWTLVEANDKNFARVKVLKTLCERLESALKDDGKYTEK